MNTFYNELASFEVAKKLKKLGYTKDTGFRYNKDGKLVDPIFSDSDYDAPTFADAIDWMMDLGIIINIDYISPACGWDYTVHRMDNQGEIYVTTNAYKSFADCANPALICAIENLVK